MKYSVLALLLGVVAAQARADSDALRWIAAGDAAYVHRDELSYATSSFHAYSQGVQADSTSVEALWKAGRSSWWVGELTPSRKDQLAALAQGMDFAQRAVDLNPDSVEAHFWLGCVMGSYGEVKGIFKSLALVKPIRREMAAVNRINDHYLAGGGYRVLGVVDYKVPGFAGGDKKRALQELQKSFAISDRDPFTYFYLAEYYGLVGNKQKRQENLDALKRLQVAPEDEPEYRYVQKKVRELKGS